MKTNKKDYFTTNGGIRSSKSGKYTLDDYVDHKLYSDKLMGNRPTVEDFLALSKKEIANQLIDLVPREQLKWEESVADFRQEIHNNSFLSEGTSTAYEYGEKIKARTLTEKEYDKIMGQIEEHGSILPTTNKRGFAYGGGGWSVILSSTTNEMYCVENEKDREKLINDYNGYQYYYSRSGASWAWNITAWKKTLIYLPTTRLDVAHPEDFLSGEGLNGLNIFAWSNRGMVDKDYPITIIPEENDENNENDFIFIDPTNIQQIFDIVKSWGEYPASFKQHTAKLWSYIDETWKKERVTTTYLSEKPIKNDMLRNIFDMTGSLNKILPDFKNPWSEFDRVLGIREKWDKYFEVWSMWLSQKLYWDENPRQGLTDRLFEYVEWDGWRLEKEYYGNSSLNIRWWNFINENIAYRKDLENEWTYIVMTDFTYDKIWLDERADALFNTTGVDHGNFVWTIVWRDNNKYTTKWWLEFEVATTDWSLVCVANWIEKKDIESVWEQLTGVEAKKAALGEFEKILPSLFKEEIDAFKQWETHGESWEKYGSLLYTSLWDKIYLGYITNNKDLNEKFSDMDYKKVQDYEKVISEKEFIEYGKAYWEDYMRKKAYEKSMRVYIRSLRLTGEDLSKKVTDYLKINLDEIFTLSDSVAVWNCVPGTESFAERYDFHSWVTAKELLKNPNYDQMIQNSAFREIFLWKIVSI